MKNCPNCENTTLDPQLRTYDVNYSQSLHIDNVPSLCCYQCEHIEYEPHVREMLDKIEENAAAVRGESMMGFIEYDYIIALFHRGTQLEKINTLEALCSYETLHYLAQIAKVAKLDHLSPEKLAEKLNAIPKDALLMCMEST